MACMTAACWRCIPCSAGDVTVPAPEGALPWLFLRRARMLLHRGNCLLVGCRGDEIVAAGGVVPFSNKPGTWDYFRNGERGVRWVCV